MNVNSSRFSIKLLMRCVTDWMVLRRLFLPSLGLPPDPAQQRYPGSSGCRSTNHAASPKPAAAPVRPEELRMCVQHPGQNPACPSRAVQQLLYPVPEHIGKMSRLLVSGAREWRSHAFHAKYYQQQLELTTPRPFAFQGLRLHAGTWLGLRIYDVITHPCYFWVTGQ